MSEPQQQPTQAEVIAALVEACEAARSQLAENAIWSDTAWEREAGLRAAKVVDDIHKQLDAAIALARSATVPEVVLGVVRKTSRGFEIIDFDDSNGFYSTLQQSSAIGDYADSLDRPGTSFVWLGVDSERMHLNREQVAGLIVRLQCWLDTGSFERPATLSALEQPNQWETRDED